MSPSPRLPRRGLAAVALGLPLLASCGSGDAPDTAAPAPTGVSTASLPSALSQQQMEALLLPGADLPGLTLRTAVDPSVEQTSAPQLALCRAPGPALPHQVANVLAKGTAPGQAVVFEVVAVYADAAAARQAWSYDVATARACPSFSASDVRYTIRTPTSLDVDAGGQAVQYRVAASNVVSGDVRTLGLRGRCTTFLTSYGQAPGGGELTAYQADAARRALSRLSAQSCAAG